MASFSVVSNVSASNAQANLVSTSIGLQKAITRLSSGFRINSSGDDAAGLAVANNYRSDQAVLNQGIRNANDGLSTLQIKDGALNNISTLIDRLSTLASQSASTSSTVNRTTLNDEFQSVLKEIDREASVAGLTAGGFSVFVSGDNGGANTGVVGGTLQAVNGVALSISTLAITSASAAAAAVSSLSAAVGLLGTAQGSVGALENRLQYSITLAGQQQVSFKAAESRIRDANVAEESANLTRYNILTQSGIAALAQANQQSQSVLTLLR
jgi:flagellin